LCGVSGLAVHQIDERGTLATACIIRFGSMADAASLQEYLLPLRGIARCVS
jgi:hypothetical protein